MMRALQTAPLACALMVAVAAFMCARVSAFLPAAPSQQQHQQHQLIQRQQRPLARTAVATLESVHGQQRQQKQQERRERLSVRLWAAEGEGDGEEIGPDHEIGEGEDGKAAAAAGNPVDDVFNSVPFLVKRKAAIEKEMDGIGETMAALAEQYEALEGEWGDKVAVMRKDYDGLKARYYNDTQETAMVGRSNVFVEIMSVVDDFERAKMAYKPQSEEEKEILAAYDGVKDAIIQGMMTQGMEEIQTVGEPFDFKLHDCMFTEQSVEYAEDIVTREFSKGFAIGGKVIRPAKVACSTGPGP